MASDFYQAVYKLVKKIPKGKVATYGQIASLLGKPKSARLVGRALAHCPSDIPWQRVINHQGMISIENLCLPKEFQAELLKKEGIEVKYQQHNWWIDLNKYLWQP